MRMVVRRLQFIGTAQSKQFSRPVDTFCCVGRFSGRSGSTSSPSSVAHHGARTTRPSDVSIVAT